MAATGFANTATATTDGGHEIIWKLISLLIAVGWTKVFQSNGSGGSVAAAADLNHASAYVVVQYPGGDVAPYASSQQIGFQRDSASSAGWRIKVSKSGAFAGGDATHMPTAGDERYINGYDASPSYANALFEPTTTLLYVVTVCSVAEHYSWYVITYEAATGAFNQSGLLFMDALLFPRSDDPHPFQYLANDQSPNYAAQDAVWSSSDIGGVMAPYHIPQYDSFEAGDDTLDLVTDLPGYVAPIDGVVTLIRPIYLSRSTGYGYKGYSTLFRYVTSVDFGDAYEVDGSGTHDFRLMGIFAWIWDPAITTFKLTTGPTYNANLLDATDPMQQSFVDVGDPDAPSIENLTPAPGTIPGSFGAATQTPIEFDLVDLTPNFQVAYIWVKFADSEQTWLLWDGTEFVAPFASGSQVVDTDATTKHFTVFRDGGWTSAFDLTVKAHDSAGNRAA